MDIDIGQFGLNLPQVQEMTRMAAPYQSNCVDSWDYSGYNLSTNYALSVSGYQLIVPHFQLESMPKSQAGPLFYYLLYSSCATHIAMLKPSFPTVTVHGHNSSFQAQVYRGICRQWCFHETNEQFIILVFNQVVPMVSDLVTLLLKLMMTGTVMRKQ